MADPHYHFGRRVDTVQPQQPLGFDAAGAEPTSHLVGSSWPGSRRVQRRISTRPGPLHKVWRWVRCAWLRFEIDSAERWMRDYGRDLLRTGVDDGVALRECRMQLQEMRVRLAVLEGGL